MSSKRNNRAFYQSQNVHHKALLKIAAQQDPDLNMFDYHMEIYRSQKYLHRILTPAERREIYHREVVIGYVTDGCICR